MKIQHTNQTLINSIASDNAWATADLVVYNEMTVKEACEAEVESAMEDMFDEENFDAPYDKAQLLAAYKAATIEAISESPLYLYNYAMSNPKSIVRKFNAVDANYCEVEVNVIDFAGKEHEVVFDDQEICFFEAA